MNDPARAGELTTEYKTGKLATITTSIIAGLTVALPILKDGGVGLYWVGAAIVAVTVIGNIMKSMNYTSNRTALKIAAIQADSPSRPS